MRKSDMGHAVSDETARKAIENIRMGAMLPDYKVPDFNVRALMMYVAERLPLEAVKARAVHWYVPYGEPGTRSRVEPMVPESNIDSFIRQLIEDGADTITIGPSFNKPVR